ncbi:MAG: molybdopterin-containing oxidoreductase family protein [Microthrixaceae bacterium]
MTELRTTACPLDCPDTCTLQVGVEDGRLVSVDAAPEGTGNPFTAGWICAKVRRHAERVHGPERILTPLVRTGPRGSGDFRETGWDEALDLVADRIRGAVDGYGPASVVPFLYNSSAGARADRLTTRLFRLLGTAEVAHTICAATAGIAWHATFPNMLSADPHDLAHSDLVVIWGANPSASNTHLTPLLTAARRRGAAVVVVDPRRTPTAARADLHLAVRPGTDTVLALALATELERIDGVDRTFCGDRADGWEAYLAAAAAWDADRAAEVCGVPADDIRTLAALVAARRPGMLRIGWGMERNRNGGAAIRAALALWVLAGQFGRPGAGVLASTSAGNHVPDPEGDTAAGTPLPPPARVLNMNRIGRELLDTDPPVRVLFVQGANPAVMAPDQGRVLEGLAREDLFTVVHEQVMTDTALMADVVLPATTHFEAADVADSYGTFTVAPMPAVIPRVGSSRTNDEVAAGIAARLGVAVGEPDLPGGPDRFTVSRPDGTVQFGPAGDAATTLPDGGRARLVLGHGSDPLPVHREADDGTRPLVLLTPATTRTINSMFAEFDPPAAVVTLHPEDAGARGLADGDEVLVVNDLAELHLPLRVDDSVRPGVAVIPKGLWRRHLPGGLTANALVPDDVESTIGGACFNDTRVEVTRA